ncbi:hypothetical protein B0H11DRAFT_1904902 [Mycena galericulata]|nr:hypothetical protein B0H11DRAFT_1904902 [Mycena galericulata]
MFRVFKFGVNWAEVFVYGGPDALLFPLRKHLTPPRKFAFFGVPAREFSSLIRSTCFARTACSAPREFGNCARDFESPRARKFEVPYVTGKDWKFYHVLKTHVFYSANLVIQVVYSLHTAVYGLWDPAEGSCPMGGCASDGNQLAPC